MHYSRVRLLFASDSSEIDKIDPDFATREIEWWDLFDFKEEITKRQLLARGLRNLRTSYINMDATLDYANNILKKIESPKNKPVIITFADRPNPVQDHNYAVINALAMREIDYYLVTTSNSNYLDNIIKYESDENRLVLKDWKDVESQQDMNKIVKAINQDYMNTFKCMDIEIPPETTESVTTTADTVTTTDTATTTVVTTTAEIPCRDYTLPDIDNIVVIQSSADLDKMTECLSKDPRVKIFNPDNSRCECNIDDIRQDPLECTNCLQAAGSFTPEKCHGQFLFINLDTDNCLFNNQPCLDGNVHQTLLFEQDKTFLVNEIWAGNEDQLESLLDIQSPLINDAR